MLQAASPTLQSCASQLCCAAAAWDAPPSRSLNCPPPPPAQPCSGDDLAGLGDSPDGSNRTLTAIRQCVRELSRTPVTGALNLVADDLRPRPTAWIELLL